MNNKVINVKSDFLGYERYVKKEIVSKYTL